MRRSRLRAYVRKTLLTRLVVGGGLIAVTVAGISSASQKQQFIRDLAQEVANDAALISASRSSIDDRTDSERSAHLDETMREVLTGLGDRRLRGDHFVMLRFFDQEKVVRADVRDPQDGAMQEFLRQLPEVPSRFPPLGDFWYRIDKVAGQTLIHVVTPLDHFEGMERAWFEGVYALSDETMAAYRAELLRAALLAFGIVLVTVAVIYPLVMSLTGRLTVLSDSLVEANLETLQVLGGAIAKRDSDTNAHNYRVTIISVRLAEAIGLSNREIRGLIKGAFLHDVGKIGIRDSILLKPGKLDDDEYAVMKTHVDHGVEIVSRSRWLADAMQVVHGHHEQVSGNGYPRSLSGDQISIAARIFAIVDVFDALTARRPYKEPFSFERTMEILDKDSGTHFDAALVSAFKSIAGDIYAGFANREDGLEDELNVILKTYFPGGKEDLDDAASLAKSG